MKYWAITDKGLVRQKNEDSYFACCNETDDFALFVVCDGMGGAQAGNVASTLACNTFVNTINEFDLRDQPYDKLAYYLYHAADAANRAVYEKSVGDVQCAGMGTTLVAALIHNNKALVLNIGDSRAYVISEDEIVQVTRDHSVVEDMVQRGEITKAEARVHPKRNLITRALGALSDFEPDIYSIELDSDEYLLLCSDGLTSVVADNEIRDTITHLEHADKVCDILLQACFQRGAPDNITIILYRN